VGNDFYALAGPPDAVFLRLLPHREEDLDTAQARKIQHICRKLRLKPGERLLDIGCGWEAWRWRPQACGVNVLGVTTR
jgi:cyclopropane-fatty-acyl-phospholipid synthase